MADPHPDWLILADSWSLALRADNYSPQTVKSYGYGVRSLAAWLGQESPDVSPADVTRDHIRAWIISVRERTSSATARTWFPGVRRFFAWAVEEGEIATNPTEGLKTPVAGDTRTPLVGVDTIKKMLDTCDSQTFVGKRDRAIIYAFADAGLRLAEVTGLGVNDADAVGRMFYVEGKGSRRSGPRRRAAPIGVKAARALDRYLRERRRHPYAELPQLWLGARGRPTLSRSGVVRMLERRAERVGAKIHAHMFRHEWASQFRKAGGQEGDLMVLGGWSSRQMLDRYGKEAAAERAQEAYRSRSLGDRL